MHPRLEHYIDLVRDITAESLPDDLMVPLIVEQAKEAFREGFDLLPSQKVPDGAHHGRHLLYEDPCSGCVVIAMAWPAGADSQPHDHGTWGVVGVLEGQLELTEYDVSDDGGGLKETGKVQAGPGDVAYVVPPHKDVHRMRNTSDSTTVTVHVYGKPIESCQAFDLETGATSTITPTYTSRPETQTA